jgi:hypothetical protein
MPFAFNVIHYNVAFEQPDMWLLSSNMGDLFVKLTLFCGLAIAIKVYLLTALTSDIKRLKLIILWQMHTPFSY